VTSIQMSAIVTYVAEAERTSFHAKKKTNFFIRVKCPSQAATHASTTDFYRMSLSLSFCHIRHPRQSNNSRL